MKNNGLAIQKGLKGMGVFTTKEIKNGKTVFKFADRVVKIDHRPGCHCKVCCRCIQVGEFDWMYPYSGSYGWYLNHSCNPNCGIRGKNIVSIRKIKIGEEITVDYSTTNADKKWRMTCRCKQKNCRKIIKSVQFLSKKKFIRYKKIMPIYIANSYCASI